MNAHLTPEIVLQVTTYEPLVILDPHLPARKETLPAGTSTASQVCIQREGREGVEWFVFPEHGGKGLSVKAFQEFRKRGLVDVEQKTADGWEDYFDEGN